VPNPKTKKDLERNVMAILLEGEPESASTPATAKVNETLLISELVPFADHPFKLYEGERLDDMVRSINPKERLKKSCCRQSKPKSNCFRKPKNQDRGNKRRLKPS
jgi:hypothetical protein